MESSEIGKLIERVKTVAHSCGAMVLDAALSYEGEYVLAASLEVEAFLELLEFIKPKIVYTNSMVLDVAEVVKESFKADEDTVLNNSKTVKLISKWKKHNGALCGVSFELVFNGVVHGSSVQANWLADFESEMKLLIEEIEDARLQDEQEKTANDQRRLSSKVQQLMADPRFSASHVGVAKRTVLAETLFPELDHDSIQIVVEKAEREHWLATAGRKT